MTQAGLEKKRKEEFKNVFSEKIPDEVGAELESIENSGRDFEGHFPEVATFLEENYVNSLHLHVFGVPLHRYPGDTEGLKLIFSEKLGLHVLVDPTPKNLRQPRPSYYSHFFILWHLLILRHFLVDERSRMLLAPDVDSTELRSEHVLRLVPTTKTCKREVFIRDEKGVKTGTTEEKTIVYLIANLMTMLPGKSGQRSSLATAPRDMMGAILYDQLFFDSTPKEKWNNYDFTLTKTILPQIFRTGLFTHFFSLHGIGSEKKLLEVNLHDVRKNIIPLLLANGDFIKMIHHNVNVALQSSGTERKDPKKKVVPLGGDFDFSPESFSEVSGLDEIATEVLPAPEPIAPQPEEQAVPDAFSTPEVDQKKKRKAATTPGAPVKKAHIASNK